MRRRIPYVQQLEISDCGAACLAMIFAYHGRNMRPEELRRATQTSRGGVDAASIVRAARAYGMDARGVKVELDGLRFLERGAILHWEFDHFVVFDRLVRGGVLILDPAFGRVRVPMEKFSRSFTGVAVMLTPSETFERTSRKSRSAWRYLSPMLRRTGLLGKVGATSFMIQLFALAAPILTGVVVDRVVPTGDRDLLGVVGAGLAVMVLFHLLSSFVRAHLLLALRAHLDVRLSTNFVGHLMKLPYRFFLQRTAGDIMTRLNSNVTVREILTTGAISTLLDGALVSIYLLLIFLQSWQMGLVVLVLAAIQLAVLLVAHKPIQRHMTEVLLAQARAQGYLAQMINGVETLKSVGAEGRAVAHWSNLFVDEVNALLARGRVNAVVETFTGTLRVASPLVVLGVGTLLVLNGGLSLGTMLALSALSIGFLAPVSNLIATGLQVQLLASYMERINDVLDSETEQEPGSVQPVGPIEGHIRLDNVRFRYDERSPFVVDGVSLEIEPGKTVGLVGPSGSGKSTLAHLILGLYAPTEGAVSYDGLDLKGIEATSLRSQLGIVPQSSYLFGTTIRENIALTYPEASFDKVEMAARLACIHEDIVAMPLGYETVLSDAGASVSGGQRQRIALARALIHEPPVLLLDEATSSLDSVTEQKIYESLEALTCTKIVIAHRIATIARADQIVVMDQGRFVESGTHSELLSRGGMYWDLARAQGQDPEASASAT